jgi:hypothetical protein
MNDRLKKIIFNKLNEDLSHVEIILHNNSLWFIDRENKYWYMEFQKGGKLYWRYQFFAKFFTIFTLERDEYEPLIKEWVESVLNCGVTTTLNLGNRLKCLVESVLNFGVKYVISADRTFDDVEMVLNNENK